MGKYEILMQKLEGSYYEGLLIEYEQDFLAPYLGELLLECLEVDKRYVARGERIRELEDALAKVGENIDDWNDTPPIREAIDDYGLLFSYEVLMEIITTALSEKSDKEDA